MKKLMILAALGTAALFTACGDDSSSSPSDGCSVSATETSVTMTSTVAGYTGSTTWTIEGDNIKVSYDPAPAEGENGMTYPKGEYSIESLKNDAEVSCAAFEAGTQQ